MLRKNYSEFSLLLISEYEPEKVVVFGSLVGGHIHPGSDIDLLIVKRTSKRPLERIQEVARLIKPRVGIDLFIYTPEECDLLL